MRHASEKCRATAYFASAQMATDVVCRAPGPSLRTITFHIAALWFP